MNIRFSELIEPLFFVGVGNSLKGDDGAGPRAAELLAAAGMSALNCGDIPENYLRQIASHRSGTIVFIDAVEMNEPAGAVKLFPAEQIALTGVFTHGMSLSMLIDLIRMETGVPVYLIGIQPKRITLGEGLSPEVEAGIAQLAGEFTRKGR